MYRFSEQIKFAFSGSKSPHYHRRGRYGDTEEDGVRQLLVPPFCCQRWKKDATEILNTRNDKNLYKTNPPHSNAVKKS